MNFFSISLIFVFHLIIQRFHSIDGSVAHIYEKVKQEVEDLIDSQDYDSVDEILKDSKVKVKYLDYYVATTKGTTQKTTTGPTSKLGSAHPGQEKHEHEEEGGGPVVLIVILVVVVIVVIGAIVGIFVFIRARASNKNVRRKVNRGASRESLASIVTVASATGQPVRKAGAAKAAPKKK